MPQVRVSCMCPPALEIRIVGHVCVSFGAEIHLLRLNSLSMAHEACLCLQRFYLNQVT